MKLDLNIIQQMISKIINLYYKNLNGKKEIESENIIADYLGLINKLFFKIEKNEYTSTYLSLPDYYTFISKRNIKINL